LWGGRRGSTALRAGEDRRRPHPRRRARGRVTQREERTVAIAGHSERPTGTLSPWHGRCVTDESPEPRRQAPSPDRHGQRPALGSSLATSSRGPSRRQRPTAAANQKTTVERPREKKKPTPTERFSSWRNSRVVLSIAAMWSASKACRTPKVYASAPSPARFG